MKVNGLGQITITGVKTKKAGHSTGGNFVDELDDGAGVEAKPAVSTAAPLGAMSSLLSLQEVPDASAGRSRGLARAQDMLKGLEEIRQGLLVGSIPESRLRALSGMVRQSRGAIDDPRLKSLLDDVELRVEVEIAKLEMSRE
jgi:hypothetical protein